MPRIIAGTHGGRTIASPPSNKTRPTSDKIREAIFSKLSGWQVLTGAKVLDLYAGTGALGFEALSRGAATLTAIEAHRATSQKIVENSRSLNFKQPVLILNQKITPQSCQSLAHNLKTEPANLLFADPPYELSSQELAQILKVLAENGALADESTLVIERSSKSSALELPAEFLFESEQSFGDTSVYYYTYLDPAITAKIDS